MKKYLALVLISFAFLSCKKETEEDLVMLYNYATNNTCPELVCLVLWPGTVHLGGVGTYYYPEVSCIPNEY